MSNLSQSFQNKEKEQGMFQQLYQDKTLVIKISGTEIATPVFKETIRDIKALIADRIKIILVFGGGKQIDKHWLQNGNTDPRQKKDGIAITSAKVLKEGVLPAHQEIMQKLRDAFSNIENTIFYGSTKLKTTLKNYAWGYTGSPSDIEVDLNQNLNVIGFVGQTETGQETNINADEIVTLLIEKYHQQITEVIFATQTGGVENQNKEITQILTLQSVEKILQNQHPHIKATAGMLKKLQEIKRLLQSTAKIAITDTKGIYNEITQLYGSGTLCVNLEKAEIMPLQNHDIFEVAYQHNIANGNWIERSSTEQIELIQNHFVLFVDNSPLGGFSLLEKKSPIDQKPALSLECWWAGEKGNGIGSKLINAAIVQAQKQGKTLFLFTHQNLNKLDIKSKFKKHPALHSSRGTPLWYFED